MKQRVNIEFSLPGPDGIISPEEVAGMHITSLDVIEGVVESFDEKTGLCKGYLYVDPEIADDLMRAKPGIELV